MGISAPPTTWLSAFGLPGAHDSVIEFSGDSILREAALVNLGHSFGSDLPRDPLDSIRSLFDAVGLPDSAQQVVQSLERPVVLDSLLRRVLERAPPDHSPLAYIKLAAAIYNVSERVDRVYRVAESASGYECLVAGDDDETWISLDRFADRALEVTITAIDFAVAAFEEKILAERAAEATTLDPSAEIARLGEAVAELSKV